MKIKIAINGLGRIGRLVLRCLIHSPQFQVVAANDLVPADNLAYLLKYDSTHGEYISPIEVKNNRIEIEQSSILILNEKNPEQLPWKDLEIDYVVECTGIFTSIEGANKHLLAGAKRVIISAPAKGDIPTIVMGVNETIYSPEKHQVVSNASCTTNCLGPLIKVIHDHFGVEEALMTTVHAMTASQSVVDAPSKKDWRGGRGAHQNIIPASTGAAVAIGKCMPELKGKITGMAFRVPVADVSVVDLTVRMKQGATYEEICTKLKEASQNELKGILEYCNEEIVSSDLIGNTASCIFDEKAGIALNDHFIKLIAWYDNEMGYASRIVDLLAYMAKLEK